MTHPTTQSVCSQCRWWQEVQDEDGTRLGLCRRQPPAYEGWPVTQPQDWCGEYASQRLH
jgi:hypothetical protein